VSLAGRAKVSVARRTLHVERERMDLAAPPIPLPLASLRAPTGPLLAVPGARRRAAQRGTVVLSSARVGRDLILVEDGLVAVWAGPLAGRRGVLCVAGAGEVLGLEAMRGPLHPSHSPASTHLEAVALAPSRLVIVATDEAERSARLEPTLAAFLLEATLFRLSAMAEALAIQLELPVAGRLLRCLRSIACAHGTSHPRGLRIELPITQELLAGLVGATRESVNRALGSLIRAGAVARDGRCYVVVPSEAG